MPASRSIAGMPLPHRRTALVVALVVGLAATTLVAPSLAVVDPSSGTLDDVPGTVPSELGDADLTELQYADPAENLALASTPVANTDGSARLTYPLRVPAGRAGVQPDLTLQYDSSAGSGWVGTGWDLSLGAVTVDTAFGVPRYDAVRETETYALDGARLSPTAIRPVAALDTRNTTGIRADYVRQVEDEFERIVRHGTTPSTYVWQVTDKDGTDRWYGGYPQYNTDGSVTAVEEEGAVLGGAGIATGAVAGDFHWGLVYVEDVSGNVMRVTYDKDTSVRIGRSTSTSGLSLYPQTVEWTGTVVDGLDDEPAYRATFVRDDGRPDVGVDARGGAPVVTADVLSEVRFEHLDHSGGGPDPVATLAGGHRFVYDDAAAFAKTLLTRIGQFGTDNEVFAWHDVDYYDEVTATDGTYAGFDAPEQWGSATSTVTDRDGRDTDTANIAATSALGSSFRGGAEGGAYIGFNPIAPSKILSFGGSFQIGGGQSGDLSSLVDLDGDGLPDKVTLDGGKVYWQRNTSATGRATDGSYFTTRGELTSIESLGISRDLRIDLHLEAYPVATVQVGGGFGFGFVERYFDDVNADGRPDFIRPDIDNPPHQVVYFNVLDEFGRPTFVKESAATEVPLAPFDSDIAHAAIGGVQDILVDSSPRIDTVRRWVAPFDGTVSIQGTATRGSTTPGDGTRVLVEHDGSQVFDRTLTATAPTATHLLTRAVDAGDAVYFRSHVIENSSGDEVTWAPTITYVDGSGTPLDLADDANGRDQAVYDPTADFTVYGRDGGSTPLTDPGPATLTVTLARDGALTDEVTVIARHHDNATGVTTTLTPTGDDTLSDGAADATPSDVTAVFAFTVGAVGTDDRGTAATDDDVDDPDRIAVEVVSDTPVDPRAFAVDIAMETTPPSGTPTDTTNPGGIDIPGGEPVVIPSVRVFARTDRTSPYAPFVPTEADEIDLDVAVSGAALRDEAAEQAAAPADRITSVAVATVKRADANGVVTVVASSAPFTIAHNLARPLLTPYRLTGDTTLTFTPEVDAEHWVEVSIHDPAVGAAVSTSMTYRPDPDRDDEPTGAFTAFVTHRPAVQGVFPSENRGWGIAGYNADHPDNPGTAAIPAAAWTFTPPGGSGSFDENTTVPSGSAVGTPQDATGDIAGGFTRSYAYLPWSGPDGGRADRWRSADKATLFGTGTQLRPARLGEEVALPGATSSPGARPAPELLTVSGDFNIMLGLGPASISGAFGGGRSLRDLLDVNGDGFSDIRSGATIEFTGPRGGRTVTGTVGENTTDTKVAVAGGLGGAAVATSNESSAAAGSNGGSSASGVAPTSTNKSRGGNVGLNLGLSAEWTNPLPESSAASEIGAVGGADLGDGELTDGSGGAGSPIGTVTERAMLDVNGDGLPDLVDTYSSGEMWVKLGLGHGFDPTQVQWARGRVDATKNVSGSFGAGFQLNAYEFSGGVAFTEGAALQQMEWVDLDGDGVPDRMEQIGTDAPPQTTFGSGDGMEGGQVTYGTYPDGAVRVDAAFEGTDIDVGQVASLGRTTALTGGFSFTVYIGPICVVACYIIINPGVSGGYERSWTEADLVDIDGDGYLDVVESLSGEDVVVHRNKHGRTNLLRSITSPLGATTTVDYERVGNTLVQPESSWVMTELEVDDARPGDGFDIARTEFSYDGSRYDRLLREQLGFSSITERQYTVAASMIDREPTDPAFSQTLERSWQRDYSNSSPFDAGLLLEERLYAGDPDAIPPARLLERTTSTWTFTDARVGPGIGDPVDVSSMPAIGTARRVDLFARAVSPRLSADEFVRFDGEGDAQSRTVRFTHDALGNATAVEETNEEGTTADNTYTEQTFPPCTTDRLTSDATVLGTWVQVPATVTVRAGVGGEQLVHRDGSLDLCDNAVPIRIVATQGVDTCGNTQYAVTELAFDPWGSYGSVRYPANALQAPLDPADCTSYPAPQPPPTGASTFAGCEPTDPVEDDRYCVDYVYDDGRHTDVALVTDNHGVSSSASYDPLTGRVASRTDEAGQTTSYTYDAQGRLATIVAPREAGGSRSTVAFSYALVPGSTPAAGTAFPSHVWATARHLDTLRSGGTGEAAATIDTAAFVDGIGRLVQRKRDAAVAGVSGDAVVVEGAVEYDALGREVKQWFPVVEQAAPWPASGLPVHLTTYNTLSSSSPTADTHVPETGPTTSEYDLLDRLLVVTAPDGSEQTYLHDIAADPTTGSMVPATTVTDPVGRAETSYVDIRGVTLTHVAAGATTTVPGPPSDLLATLPTPGIEATSRIAPSAATGPDDLVTTYTYDPLARLTGIEENDGSMTTHTYDMLGNRTSTTTPDSGLTEWFHTPAGQIGAVVDEVRRGLGTAVHHRYDRDRLHKVEHPDDTPDVTYTYGEDLAPSPALSTGRVARVVDGSMTRTYAYDVDGNVATEAATRAQDPFGISDTDPVATFTTAWTYDSIGRLATMTYPEGEALTTAYDAGGRPATLTSLAPQPDRYDRFGTAVPQPDAPITYIEDVAYDEFGEVVSLTTGTGVTTTYDRDPERRMLVGLSTDSVARTQFDGTTSPARELQRLRYSYDRVGNVLDVANALFDDGSATTLADLGVPPENNVPGAAQQAYTYDPHYRLTSATAQYVDRKEARDATYDVDRAANGTLVSKAQATTTTSTTGGGSKGGGSKPTKSNNKKKNDEPPSGEESTDTGQCDGDTGTGGGSANQDPATTYVLHADDMAYDPAAPHRLLQAGDRTYTHDANGNLTSWVQPCGGGTSELLREYGWDAQNRVVLLGQGSNDTEYRYDAEGARALERGPGGTTWFVNEHWRVVNDGHRYAEVFLGGVHVASHRTSPPPAPPPPCDPAVDPDGCLCDPATMVCDCADPTLCCDDLTGTHDATAETCTPHPDLTIHFLHRDLQGSLRVATDEVGDVFQYVEYLPTGQPWVAGQSRIKDTPYLFAGGWTDPTYSLVNFGARWFSPREEAFISPEPLLTEDPTAVLGDPTMLSAYTYASANPLRYVDPDGRASRSPIDFDEPYQIAQSGKIFDLGKGFDKHAQGTFTISTARREGRQSPARLGTLLVSYDAKGQQRQAKAQAIDDAISRYTTPLAFDTSGDRVKVRIFGGTVRSGKAPASSAAGAAGGGVAPATNAPPTTTQGAPNPGPSNSGANGPPPTSVTPAQTSGAAASTPPRTRAASATSGSASLPPAPRPRAASDAAVGL